MENIAIYTLTSELHDEQAVNRSTQEFLDSLNLEFDLVGSNYETYGDHTLNLIYVRTGGTEGVLKPLLPSILGQSHHPIYLLTSGKSNSLAASMEILSYLRQQNIRGEIIHGSTEYIRQRITLLCKVAEVEKKLSGMKLGIIGKPSDWLISSDVDKDAVRQHLGITLEEITMAEMFQAYTVAKEPLDSDDVINSLNTTVPEAVKPSLPGAMKIYNAIKSVVEKHHISGFTIRCFDLLTAFNNTGCIALAKLNAEGIVAGCEGDVPSMLSMAITKAVTGVSGFQANPARINPETGEMLFAHCTIPLNMVERYELDTHFESGIGVGIRGFMKEGDVTIFKVSGDTSRHFVAEGKLVRNQGEPDLCRTQQVIQLSNPQDAKYFLTNPIGNHHIIMPGHHKEILEAILK